jgi:GntR family transcriptional regulator
MLPFAVHFKPGLPPYEQVVYAVTKAIVTGQLNPGDKFPSVRVLSQELRINPNTAHKVVAVLVNQGLLEVKPGIGTVVAHTPMSSPEQRSHLLKQEVERLVVEAKRLSLDLKDVLKSVQQHWNHLDEEKL